MWLSVMSNCICYMYSVQTQSLSFFVLDAAFPRIVPNRLQFFEYESIFKNCTTEQRVMRTLKEINQKNISNWVTSAGSGTVKPAFSFDSGEYWCEDGEGLRSNAVNISVTGMFSN